MSEVQQSVQSEQTEPSINLTSIFNKQHSSGTIEEAGHNLPKKRVKEKVANTEVEDKIEEDSPSEEQSDKKEEMSSKNEELSDKKEFDYKAEYEKLQKSYKDTQKSFHEDRKKLAAYKKAVEKMKEENILIEEEANLLLDHTKYEEIQEDEPLYVRYGKIWDKEIEYMRKYAPNPKEIDQQILAFQHFMQTASPQEAHDTLTELSQYEDDEVEFTRQMLNIGRQYHDDIYSDIHEAGSIRNLKLKYSEREAELQKKIDNLEKKLNKYKEKYEDYDPTPANMKLPTGSGSHNPPTASFDLAQIFNKPYQRNSGF